MIDALKRQLRARGTTYAELGRRIGLSESSVKRLFSTGNFTLPRLERICGVLQLSLAELARASGGGTSQRPATLTESQEQLLASEPSILACFYLLLNGRTTQDCRERLALAAPAVQAILVKLAGVGLLTGRGKAMELNARLPITWRADGPVRRLYERQVREEFMRCGFNQPAESLAFHSAELSSASLRVLTRKLERLAGDFAELAALDAALPPREKSSVGMLLALRPWVFSMFDSLRGGSATSTALPRVRSARATPA